MSRIIKSYPALSAAIRDKVGSARLRMMSKRERLAYARQQGWSYKPPVKFGTDQQTTALTQKYQVVREEGKIVATLKQPEKTYEQRVAEESNNRQQTAYQRARKEYEETGGQPTTADRSGFLPGTKQGIKTMQDVLIQEIPSSFAEKKLAAAPSMKDINFTPPRRKSPQETMDKGYFDYPPKPSLVVDKNIPSLTNRTITGQRYPQPETWGSWLEKKHEKELKQREAFESKAFPSESIKLSASTESITPKEFKEKTEQYDTSGQSKEMVRQLAASGYYGVASGGKAVFVDLPVSFVQHPLQTLGGFVNFPAQAQNIKKEIIKDPFGGTVKVATEFYLIGEGTKGLVRGTKKFVELAKNVEIEPIEPIPEFSETPTRPYKAPAAVKTVFVPEKVSGISIAESGKVEIMIDILTTKRIPEGYDVPDVKAAIVNPNFDPFISVLRERQTVLERGGSEAAFHKQLGLEEIKPTTTTFEKAARMKGQRKLTKAKFGEVLTEGEQRLLQVRQNKLLRWHYQRKILEFNTPSREFEVSFPKLRAPFKGKQAQASLSRQIPDYDRVFDKYRVKVKYKPFKSDFDAFSPDIIEGKQKPFSKLGNKPYLLGEVGFSQSGKSKQFPSEAFRQPTKQFFDFEAKQEISQDIFTRDKFIFKPKQRISQLTDSDTSQRLRTSTLQDLDIPPPPPREYTRYERDKPPPPTPDGESLPEDEIIEIPELPEFDSLLKPRKSKPIKSERITEYNPDIISLLSGEKKIKGLKSFDKKLFTGLERRHRF